MEKTIGVLVIHGMGTRVKDYDVPFKNRLFKRLRKQGKNPEQIAYQKIYWAEFLNARQKTYFDLVRANPLQKLGWGWGRNFVINNLSDAAAYENQHGRTNKNYSNILKEIFTAVRDIRNQLQSDDKPLLIFAHSLGCFIISNYIWDAHKYREGIDPGWPAEIALQGNFEQMVNLTGMVTFGCNLPLFVLGKDPVEAIRFPHPEMLASWKDRAEWRNYYDPKDILGWPLKELGYSADGVTPPDDVFTYSKVVTEDKPIRIWTWNPASWTPFSHVFYWKHKNFIRPASEFVGRWLD